MAPASARGSSGLATSPHRSPPHERIAAPAICGDSRTEVTLRSSRTSESLERWAYTSTNGVWGSSRTIA